MTEGIRRAIQRAINGIKLPFQAIVKGSSSALAYTLEKGLSRVNRTNIEALQHYGLVSRLPVGTRVIVIPRMGATEKLVIVSESHETALSLSEGDVALERASGEHVHLKAGSIEITAAGGIVNIAADTVNVNGATAVNLAGGAKTLVNEDFFLLYNAHTHGGVQSGGGSTAVPTVLAASQKTVKTKAT